MSGRVAQCSVSRRGTFLVALMLGHCGIAADAGALSGMDIISIGGSGRGADSALVLKPAHQNTFFDMRIREIICKPRQF